MQMEHVRSNEQLVSLIRAGEDATENMGLLCKQIKGFVRSVAWKYRGYAEVDDLEQEGYLALYPAVAGYDPAAGCKFLTYAGNWIRQAMERYIQNNGTVRIPVHEQERMRQYERFVDVFCSQIGREPSDQELVYYLAIEPDDVQRIRISARLRQLKSLDALIIEDGQSSFGDIVPDPVNIEDKILNRMETQQFKELLWSEVDSLPGNQSRVLRSLYQEGKTAAQTGELLGTSANRIRTIKQSALRELRKDRHMRRLAPFLPEVYGSQAYRYNGIGEFNRTWTSSTERLAMKLSLNGINADKEYPYRDIETDMGKGKGNE